MSETQRKFECYDCKYKWGEPYGTGRPHQCPKCRSTNTHRHSADKGGRGINSASNSFANSAGNSARRGKGLCLRGTQRT